MSTVTALVIDATIDTTVALIPDALRALAAPGPVVTLIERCLKPLADELKKRVHAPVLEQLPALRVPASVDLERELQADIDRLRPATLPAPPPARDTDEQPALDDTDPAGSLLDRRHT